MKLLREGVTNRVVAKSAIAWLAGFWHFITAGNGLALSAKDQVRF
jgi:hypothetical protein